MIGGNFWLAACLPHTLLRKGVSNPMSRQPQRNTFVVPPAPTGSSAVAKPVREAAPFVVVPSSFVIADEKLEPHWLPTIDAATD
jgi:hypothetical protein